MYSWEEFDKRKGNYWRIRNKMRPYRQRKPRRRLHTSGKLVTIPMRYRQGGAGAPPLRPQGGGPAAGGAARRSRDGRGPLPAGCTNLRGGTVP